MERSSPSRTAGTAMREVTLGGKKYLLSQCDKVRRAAEEEAVIISRRLDMLPAVTRACAGLPDEERAGWRAAYIERMMCGIASMDEWESYERSLWKVAYRFWNALDPHYKLDENDKPKTLLVGVEWAYQVLQTSETTRDEWDALMIAVRIVSQEELVKNSSGSEGTSPTPPTEPHSTEDGQPSTSSS